MGGAICFGDWAIPGEYGSVRNAMSVADEIHELEK
jgi:hypothetical protein